MKVRKRFDDAVFELKCALDDIKHLQDKLVASNPTIEDNGSQDMDSRVVRLQEMLKGGAPSASTQKLAHNIMQKCAKDDDSDRITLSRPKKRVRSDDRQGKRFLVYWRVRQRSLKVDANEKSRKRWIADRAKTITEVVGSMLRVFLKRFSKKLRTVVDI